MGFEDGMRSRERDKEKRDFGGGMSPIGALWGLLMLVAVVGTNVVVIYSLTLSRERADYADDQNGAEIPDSLLAQFNTIKEELGDVRRNLLNTQAELKSSQEQLFSSQQETHKLLQATSALIKYTSSSKAASQLDQQYESRRWEARRSLLTSKELDEYTYVRALPLGHNPALGSDSIVSSIGHACYANKELLEHYMNYTIGILCPDDWTTAQTLMIRGCEPLPRRRCFARTPQVFTTPLPFPESLWGTPPDDTVLWSLYPCKSFDCLNRRAKESKSFVDCADCFDLEGPERYRWIMGKDRHDFKIADVVAFKKGGLRLGLDIGGGSGSFAARFREYNVTILTSTLNLNGPFNEFIALRGLPSLFLSISQRLPFFDNTLDLVHSMHVLSHWIPTETLEFLLYDIDRVLRPGGLLWLDHFFSTEDKLLGLYMPMIEQMGYNKIKWVTGVKNDRNGIRNNEVYLSAVLEKPPRIVETLSASE